MIWRVYLRKCVEHPGEWQRSHRYLNQRSVEQMQYHFKHDTMHWDPGTVEKHILKGSVGTWYFCHGVCEDHIGIYPYMWFKFVPDGRRNKGPAAPEEGRRVAQGEVAGTRKLRKIYGRDIHSKRSDG